MDFLEFLGRWFFGWRGVVSYIMVLVTLTFIIDNKPLLACIRALPFALCRDWKDIFAGSIFLWIAVNYFWISLAAANKKAEAMYMLHDHLSRKLEEEEQNRRR
jgi:hypothetical protein